MADLHQRNGNIYIQLLPIELIKESSLCVLFLTLFRLRSGSIAFEQFDEFSFRLMDIVMWIVMDKEEVQ